MMGFSFREAAGETDHSLHQSFLYWLSVRFQVSARYLTHFIAFISLLVFPSLFPTFFVNKLAHMFVFWWVFLSMVNFFFLVVVFCRTNSFSTCTVSTRQQLPVCSVFPWLSSFYLPHLASVTYSFVEVFCWALAPTPTPFFTFFSVLPHGLHTEHVAHQCISLSTPHFVTLFFPSLLMSNWLHATLLCFILFSPLGMFPWEPGFAFREKLAAPELRCPAFLISIVGAYCIKTCRNNLFRCRELLNVCRPVAQKILFFSSHWKHYMLSPPPSCSAEGKSSFCKSWDLIPPTP